MPNLSWYSDSKAMRGHQLSHCFLKQFQYGTGFAMEQRQARHHAELIVIHSKKEKRLKRSPLNQTRVTRGFLLMSLLYLSLSSVQAAGTPDLKNLNFADVDRNHDGVIDMQEASAIPELAAIFKSADTNQDGYLTEKEFQAAINPTR